MAEIALFVARLQYAPVLHHHAHLPCEAKRQQKPLHGRRQHFRRLHLSPKLPETLLFVHFLIRFVVCHRAFWPLGCRDPIDVNFHGQGQMNIAHLWKTFCCTHRAYLQQVAVIQSLANISAPAICSRGRNLRGPSIRSSGICSTLRRRRHSPVLYSA